MRFVFHIVRYALAAAAGYAAVWALSDPDYDWVAAAEAARAEREAARAVKEEDALEEFVGLLPASDRIAPPFDGIVLPTAAIELVREAEPLTLEPVRHVSGGWVIGYGHVSPERPLRALTREEAEGLLREDLAVAEGAVRRSIQAPLNDNEYAALVEFALSIGPENFEFTLVAALVNAEDREAAADAFLLWNKVRIDGALVPDADLAARRRRTKALFLSGASTADS